MMVGTVVLLALLVFDAAVSGFSEEKRLSVYSGTASYSLRSGSRTARNTLACSKSSAPGVGQRLTDGGLWRLNFNRVDSEFTPGKTRARVGGKNFDLPANFWLENGHGLVPAEFSPGTDAALPGHDGQFSRKLAAVVYRQCGGPFHCPGEQDESSHPGDEFHSPVNPTIATEPGKLRMVFTREPLVPPGSQTLTFDSPSIPSATFQENNGAAEIAVNGPVPLFASFSNNGHTITITPAPQPVSSAQAPAAPPAVAPGGTPSAGPAWERLCPRRLRAPVHFFVVVDASHGGDERGAALSDQLAEKDVTLAFGLRLGQQLQAHGISTLVLREGDATMSLDQRANMTNAAHPAIYICLHAASQGTGVRLYTALLPVGSENQGPFLDWNTAQSGFHAASQSVEASLATELGKKQIAVRSLLAPLRPLNNITAAAVAIEDRTAHGQVADLNSAAYQQLVAESVTAGIEAVRNQLGGVR